MIEMCVKSIALGSSFLTETDDCAYKFVAVHADQRKYRPATPRRDGNSMPYIF